MIKPKLMKRKTMLFHSHKIEICLMKTTCFFDVLLRYYKADPLSVIKKYNNIESNIIFNSDDNLYYLVWDTFSDFLDACKMFYQLEDVIFYG